MQKLGAFDFMIASLPFPNIDPTLISFEIFGITLAIRWYALAYLAGFLLAYLWIRSLLRKTHLWPNNSAPMTFTHLDDLLTWMVLGTILGGRIGHTLFYNPEIITSDPMAILRVWEGGMSFHGGFIGVIVAGYLFSKRNDLNPWSVGDAIASSACFGLFFGRIANFIKPELWGRPTDVPWGVVFPTQAAQDCGLTAFGDCARHPSQLYEAGLEGLVLFAFFLFMIFARNALLHPGKIIAWFFIGYGLARVIVEGFRQADEVFIRPDNPLGHVIRLGENVDSLGLTMGQVLSLPMIAIGVILLFVRRRHDSA